MILFFYPTGTDIMKNILSRENMVKHMACVKITQFLLVRRTRVSAEKSRINKSLGTDISVPE